MWMPSSAPNRCGTCELLVRSGSSGLDTWGKCPHRTGWVRTFHDACEHHVGDRKQVWVRVGIALNVLAACFGYGTFVYMDVLNGSLLSHALLVLVAVITVVFALFIRWKGYFCEDAKFEMLEHQEPPPEDEEPWWRRDDRP
jgi:hypothetical protein